MDKNKIKLSIIIPFYNPGKLLNTCLASILDEIPASTEIILVDDGSTQEYKVPKNKIIKLIKNKRNMGVSHSRNLGIVEAKGDYIMFVDADDLMKVGWGQKIHEAKKDADIIYFSKNNLINNKNIILKQILGLNNDGIHLAGPYSKLYKRKFIEKNELYFKEDLINGEDMLFNAEALIASGQIAVINAGIYLYRVNHNSSTKSFNEKIFQNDILFSKYLQSILPKKYNELIHTLSINGLYVVLDRIANLPHAKAIRQYDKVDKSFYLEFMDKIKTLDIHKRLAINAFMTNRQTLSYYIIRIRKKASKIRKQNSRFMEI